jgi:hypothetical protein
MCSFVENGEEFFQQKQFVENGEEFFQQKQKKVKIITIFSFLTSFFF